MIDKLTRWGYSRYTSIVARTFLSAVFIVIGGSKVMNFAGTSQFLGAAGFPMPEVFTVIAIIFELGGGLMLLFGLKKRLAITMLLVFTAVVTALFHVKTLLVDQTQMVMFLKNLAIMGGLLALYKGCGCGHGDCTTCNNGTCTTCEVKEPPKVA